MKKAITFAVIFLTALVLILPVKKIFAAPTDESILNQLYDDDFEMSKTETGTSTSDNYKSESMGTLSAALRLNRTFYGLDLVADSDPLKIKLLSEKPYLRYGLVQNGTTMMTNAFLQGPSVNVPGYYAQMLLPKQILETGGTAYAANEGDPPSSTSATEFLSNMGLNKLWGVSFTLAMSILVIILMIAGFMIMFRSKAGGQVVVTVSMALQNAVVGAILALASFALGAFFLNLSKYLVQVVAVLFQEMVFKNSGIGIIYINGPWNLFRDFFMTTVWGTVQQDADSWWKAASQGIIGQYNPNGTWWSAAVEKIQFFAKAYGEGIAFTFITLLARIVIGAAILVTSIRVFWTVLSTYIKMIIDIVIAPLLMMVSSLPGKQAGISAWLGRMFKNAIAIPVMFAFVNIAAYMAFAVASATGGCSGAGKSILTCITGGLIPAGSASGSDWLLLTIGPPSVVALVILNMVPAVPVMLDQMIPAPKGSGDFSKAWQGAQKSLQSMPVVGSFFQ